MHTLVPSLSSRRAHKRSIISKSEKTTKTCGDVRLRGDTYTTASLKSLVFVQTLYLCIHVILLFLPLEKFPHWHIFVRNTMLSVEIRKTNSLHCLVHAYNQVHYFNFALNVYSKIQTWLYKQVNNTSIQVNNLFGYFMTFYFMPPAYVLLTSNVRTKWNYGERDK